VTRFELNFGNERFDYNPWVPVLAGLAIAVVSSALGVGGGFLLVPFMSMVLGLPMTIVAGTAALAIFISSVTSIGNYVRLGVELDIPLLALLLIGTVAGSFLGPILSRYFREAWFKALLATILFLISVRYLTLSKYLVRLARKGRRFIITGISPRALPPSRQSGSPRGRPCRVCPAACARKRSQPLAGW